MKPIFSQIEKPHACVGKKLEQLRLTGTLTDYENFYNPKINKVSITLDGNHNQLYSSGMLKHQQ